MTDTSKREELIEEAAKAIWEESTDPSRKWRWEDESGYVADEYANQARAALAVFERAYKVSDRDLFLANLPNEENYPDEIRGGE